MAESFDVAIIGAGPAGSAAAIELGTLGLSAILVDRSDFVTRRVGEHLNPQGVKTLEDLGWRLDCHLDLAREGTVVCSAWESSSPVVSSYLFNPLGAGLNLSRPAFEKSLHAIAKERGTVVQLETNVLGLHQLNDEWLMQLRSLDQSREVRAKFLIDATGWKASMARRLGAKRHVEDTLVCFHAVFGGMPRSLTAKHETEALIIESHDQGWCYSVGLPTSKGSYSIACGYLVDLATAASSKPNPGKWLSNRLSTIPLTAERVAGMELSTVKIELCPSQMLEPSSGKGWLAIGDAASCFDPLASEGIAKALKTGREAGHLARLVLTANRDSPSSQSDVEATRHAAFAKYSTERKQLYKKVCRWPDSRFWQNRAE